MASMTDASSRGDGGGSDLYRQAVDIVLKDRKPTTSYLQRRLGIGYNRAASLIERMEQEGDRWRAKQDRAARNPARRQSINFVAAGISGRA